MVGSGISPPSFLVLEGLEPDDEEEEANRDRRIKTVSTYARSSTFSPRTLSAYGRRCAMCGLGLGLVEAAHVLAVESGLAGDVVPNEFAACPLHHRIFDSHQLFVDPITRAITFSPEFLATQASPSDAAFIESTFSHLMDPSPADLRVGRAWLDRRYSFYAGLYQWATDVGGG